MPEGLASRIHKTKVSTESKTIGSDPNEIFYIKGPMGRGL